MDSRSVKLALFLVLVVCVGSALPLWAQSSSSGTVAGSVTDQSAAVVPGATVTLTDTATKSERTTMTNKDGRYIYVDVTPGIYDISATKKGFATTKTEKQEVLVGAALTVNLALQVGGASVVVEVQGAGNELQTMNATVGNDLTSIAIDNLPSLGRDVSTFVELQPGVGTDGSVGGAFNDQNYFTLDGGNNTNDMDGNMSIYTNSYAGDPTGGVAGQFFAVSAPTGVIPTPQDSVEEFKVNTTGQTADFNSSAGAEIKVITKRGTSAYHGTAYEYYKDNNWSSNSWQNNYNGIAIPSFHYSRFGGAIGGPLFPTKIKDTKTFFFVNYEGFHFPNSETISRNVASPALRLGLVTDPITGTIFNLNPAGTTTTYNGNMYPGNSACPTTGPCTVSATPYDPLLLGPNPIIQQIWNTYEPQSNATCTQSLCDGVNVLGFSGNLSIPETSKFGVVRIDHDFNAKWHFNTVYHYFNLVQTVDDQVDIGGFFAGDKLGVPASVSSSPQQAWSWVAGLTTNVTSNVTNDFHYSWLRNWWQWARHADTPQVAGLGGAIEIESGQSETQDLGPYNSNNQQTRTRFWDGHDQMFRDDLTWLRGNHLFQFGGIVQHNWDWHQRNDSGGAINEQPVYGVGDGTNGSLLSQDVSFCATQTVAGTNDIPNCGSVTAAALGIVSVSSQAYTRTGAALNLLPPLTPAFDQVTVPYYNLYFSDTWHLKPTFTLTYGLGWTVEMPPTEANQKQILAVDAADQPLSTPDYLAARKRAALAGQVYNPEIGFALLGNTANSPKYPYNPFYGEFSPRIAAAWNPRFDSNSIAGKLFGHEDTVIRGGYGRVYGRLNGVTQVLLPLLGLGFIQPVSCNQNLSVPGAAGAYNGNGSCGGTGTANLSNAFRLGLTPSTTGGPVAPVPLPTATLPQPDYPGYNNTGAADPAALDPNFRPSVIDSFNLTIQRQLTRKVTLELGYIGRRITHDFEPINLNAVPYMMTLGGQTFANAYANTVLQYCGGIPGLAGGGCGGAAGPNPGAVQPQPFFETALAGTGYCTGFTNCTQAVVANEGANGTYNLVDAGVFGLWSDLDNGGFNFPRSMSNTPIASTCVAGVGFGCSGQYSSGVSVDSSIGYGNYNAGFASLKMADWKGLTAQSNFTWSKALGTASIYQAVSSFTVDDPYNLGEGYGRQGFDRRITYNAFLVYQPPFFKGQSGPMGRLLGGWTFASVFTAGSGTPIEVGSTFFLEQEFGSADGIGFGNDDTAVPIGPVKHQSAHYCSVMCAGQQAGDGLPVNAYASGSNEVNNWRNPILGLDNRDCGAGCISGLRYWNTDFSIKKNVKVAESISLEFQGVFTNVFNHNQWLDANFNYLGNGPGFGALGGSAQSPAGGNRQIEVGGRVRF
ncbi:MAG: carboxypeptidase regulatory-like domain-containing protein [Candidatus Sulfotelmatobacter sp.]|jgi:carboxypeptidase family protein